MSKPWKCRVGWHSWIRRPGNPDPNLQVCRHCGKKNDITWIGGLGGSGG